jgi:hemolysin III
LTNILENADMTEETSNVLPKFYSAAEERLNIVSHALGLVLSLVAVVLLVLKAAQLGTTVHVISFGIFGLSLVTLYAASTIYHSAKEPTVRTYLRTVDHAAIYILIAGSYTPFTLAVLPDKLGWIIFGVSWGMAVTGIILKLFFTGRFNLFSTLMYVFMGWVIVFAIKPLMAALSDVAIFWLFAGGIAYTLGAAFYAIKKMPFGHAVFHFFVLAGSACHFIAVYWYILPEG